MRLLLSFLLIIGGVSAFASNLSVPELRALYYQALEDKKSADKFISIIDETAATMPILVCYKGMACMLKVKYTFNPYSKLSEFQKGEKLLEQAVHADVNNAEIRFMRYCVQTNAPFFLGYNDDIERDRVFLIKVLSTIPEDDLRKKIKDYVFSEKSEKNNF